MSTPLRTALRRTAVTLAAGAMLATGLSLAVAAPSHAASYECTISFTPNTIGPGQVTQAVVDLDAPMEAYYSIVTVNGVATGGPQSLESTTSGSVPYETFAPFTTGSTEPVVLDFQIYWQGFARRGAPAQPLCHATLTLLPQTVTPPPPPNTPPTTPTTGGKLSVAAPKSLPLSAGTARIQATSTAGGAVALTSLTPKVCGVSGSVAQLHRAGVCTVSATQAGADEATTSIRVWATPVVPRKATTPRVVTVLGQGEGALRVSATPASVCRTTGGSVALIDAGTCKITVSGHGDVVRRAKVKVALSADSAKVKHALTQAATVYFDYNSAQLTDRGQAALRASEKKLRKAHLVVVYGNTFGPGKNSKHSQALAKRRAEAVADYLGTLGVKAKPTTIPLAMRQPVSQTAWKNRRAEVYYR